MLLFGIRCLVREAGCEQAGRVQIQIQSKMQSDVEGGLTELSFSQLKLK